LCTIKATINYWLHLLSANANSLIYHSYQENTLRKDGLCSKIKLLLAEIGLTHVWVNQGTFSKSKLLHSLSIKLEDRYINHWNKLLFNDDSKNGGNKLRTYRKLKNSYKMENNTNLLGKYIFQTNTSIFCHNISINKCLANSFT
jgi:hypothetical protein